MVAPTNGPPVDRMMYRPFEIVKMLGISVISWRRRCERPGKPPSRISATAIRDCGGRSRSMPRSRPTPSTNARARDRQHGVDARPRAGCLTCTPTKNPRQPRQRLRGQGFRALVNATLTESNNQAAAALNGNGHADRFAAELSEEAADVISGLLFIWTVGADARHAAQVANIDCTTTREAKKATVQHRVIVVAIQDDDDVFRTAQTFAQQCLDYGASGVRIWRIPRFGIEHSTLRQWHDAYDFVRTLELVHASQYAEFVPFSPVPAPANGQTDYATLSDEQMGIIPAESVQERPIDWLWPYRLAVGEMALLAGDGGLGKSSVLLAIAAIITRGAEWPDGAGSAPVGDVVIVSAEDSRETTLKPRLMALGADLDREFGSSRPRRRSRSPGNPRWSIR